MATNPLVQRYDSETAQVLEDLVRDSPRVLLPATAIVGWVWVSIAILAVESRTAHGLAVLALILATVVAGYVLHRRRLALAVGLYLAGLTAAVTAIVVAFGGPAVLYLYIPVILLTAMLANPRTMWCATVASMGLVLLVGLAGRGLPLAHVISVLLRASGSKPLSWPPSRPATLPCAVRPRECCGA